MHTKKSTSWLLILTILLTQILSPEVAQAVDLKFEAFKETAQIQHWNPSADLGRIVKRIPAERPNGTLIHIQDAHAVLHAQKSIQALAQEIEKQFSAFDLFLEGGAGQLDPTLRHLFPQGIALTTEEQEVWMREGHLTGAEAFLMQSKKARGFGIENVSDYWSNVEAYRSVDAHRAESGEFLKVWQEEWQKRASVQMKPALRKYLGQYARAQSDVAAFVFWFDALQEYVKGEWKRDLSSIEEQIEFPMLARYAYLKKIDGALDFTKIENQKQNFSAAVRSGSVLDAKQRGLTPMVSVEPILQSIDTLIEKSKSGHADFSGARETFEKLAGFLPDDFSMAAWPDLKKLIERIILSSEMDVEALQSEARKLHAQIIEKDAREPAIRRLALLLAKHLLLAKLLHLEISREEFKKIKKHSLRPCELAQSLKTAIPTKCSSENLVGVMKEMDDLYEAAIQFYQGAVAREKHFAESIQAGFKKTSKKNLAVAVTGGFHAEGVEIFARENNLNYVGVMPRIAEINADDFARYRRALLGTETSEVAEEQHSRLGRAEVATSQVAAPLNTSAKVFNDPRAAEREELALSFPGATEALRKMKSHVAPRDRRNSPRMRRSATRPHNSDSPNKARSEIRELPTVAKGYFDNLPAGDNRDIRLMGAIQEILDQKEKISNGRGVSLSAALRESTASVSRKISFIEEIANNVYAEYQLQQLPWAYRVGYALSAYDETTFPNINRYLQRIVKEINPAKKHVSSDRLTGAEQYAFFTKLFSEAGEELSFAENILLQDVVNKIILDIPRIERRALEKEALVTELMRERETPGTGNVPQIVFITDYHGSTRIGSMIGHALGLKNYQNIRTNEELEARLADEKIDLSKMNVLFVGGSDYVDRGPEPLSGFRFNEFLRKHGKLKFINGNHEWWKDWNILGMHLRVHDTLRKIAETTGLKDEEALKSIWPFVTTVNWTSEQIESEKVRILKLLHDFRNAMVSASPAVREEIIEDVANQIIDAGTNPNHSLEWWAREWYEHSQWADVFLDQLNAELINEAIQKVHRELQDKQLVNLSSAIQQSAVLTDSQKKILIDRLTSTGRLFDVISSESFAQSPNVIEALKKSAQLKEENARIRAENEKLAAAGRHDLMKPQHKVPTAFQLTANEAQEIFSEILHVVDAANQYFKTVRISEISLPRVQLVNPDNYRVNPVVMKTTLWDLKEAALMFTDVMENFFVHGIIPITADRKEFNVHYKNLSGVDAIERIQYDIRIFVDSVEEIEDTPEFRERVHQELGDAFDVINEWYSDTLALLKPASIRGFMNQGGPMDFPYEYASATSPRVFKGRKGVVHVGHVEAGKLLKEGIPYWFGGIEGGLIHGDYEASEGGYAGLGAYISHFRRDENGRLTGILRLGYAETAVNYDKQIKKKKKELQEERAKPDGGDKVKISKFENEIGQMQVKIDAVKKTGDVITDITLSSKDLPPPQQDLVGPLMQGESLIDYYVVRFLQENIETYQSLLNGAKARGHNGRISYYEAKKNESEGKLEEYLRKFKAQINPSILAVAMRSEMREEELKAKLQMLSAAIETGVEVNGKKGKFDFLPGLKNLMDPWLDFYLNANEQDKAILNGIFDSALQTHKKLVEEHRRASQMSGGSPAAKSFFQVEISGLEDLFKKQRGKEKYKSDSDETRYLVLIAGNLNLMLSHQRALLPYNPFLVEGNLSQEQKNPTLLIQAVKAAHQKLLEGWATFPRRIKGGYFFVPRGGNVAPTDKWFSPAAIYSLLSLGFKPVLTEKKLAYEFAKRRILQATVIPAAEENQQVPLLKIIYDEMSDKGQPDAVMAYLLKKPLPSGGALNYESFLESIETDPEVLEGYVIDLSKSLDEMDAAHRKLMQAAQEGRLLSFGEMFLGNEAVEHYVRSLLGELADKEEWKQAIQKNAEPSSGPTLNAGLPNEDEMDITIQGSLNNFKTREILNRLFVGAQHLDPESNPKWRDDNGRLNKLLDKLEGHPKLVDAFMILMAVVLRLDAPGKWNLKFEFAEAAVDRLSKAEASLETILSELIQDKQAPGELSSQRNLQANLFALFQLRLFGEKHLPSLKSWLEAIALALKEERETEEAVRNQLRQAMNLSVPVMKKTMAERKQVWTALLEANVLPVDFFKEKFGLANQLMQANLDWVLVYEDVLFGMVLNWAQTDAKKMIEEWQRLGAIQSDQDYEAEIKKRIKEYRDSKGYDKKKAKDREQDIRNKIQAIVAREKADLEKKLDAISAWVESNESALSLGPILQEKAALFGNGTWPQDWKRFFPIPEEREQAPVVVSDDVARGYWDWSAIRKAVAITGETPKPTEPVAVLPAAPAVAPLSPVTAVPAEKIDLSWNEANGFGSREVQIFKEFSAQIFKFTLIPDGKLNGEDKKVRQTLENRDKKNLTNLAADVLLLLIDIRKFELAVSESLEAIENAKTLIEKEIKKLGKKSKPAQDYLMPLLTKAFDSKAAPIIVAQEKVAAEARQQIEAVLTGFHQKPIDEFSDEKGIQADVDNVLVVIDGTVLAEKEKTAYREQLKKINDAKKYSLKIWQDLAAAEKAPALDAERSLISLKARSDNLRQRVSESDPDFNLLQARFEAFEANVQKSKEIEALRKAVITVETELNAFRVEGFKDAGALVAWHDKMDALLQKLPKTEQGEKEKSRLTTDVEAVLVNAAEIIAARKKQVAPVVVQEKKAEPVAQKKLPALAKPMRTVSAVEFNSEVEKLRAHFNAIEKKLEESGVIEDESYVKLADQMKIFLGFESTKQKDKNIKLRIEMLWLWLEVLQAWSEGNKPEFVAKHKAYSDFLNQHNRTNPAVLNLVAHGTTLTEMKLWSSKAHQSFNSLKLPGGLSARPTFISFSQVTRSESRVNQLSEDQLMATRVFAAGFVPVEVEITEEETIAKVMPAESVAESNRRAQNMLGLPSVQPDDAFVLGADLALKRGFLAAAKKVFPEVFFAVIMEGSEKTELQSWLKEQALDEVVIVVENVQQARAELVKRNAKVFVRGLAITATSEADVLSGDLPMITFTSGQLDRMLSFAGVAKEAAQLMEFARAFATAA